MTRTRAVRAGIGALLATFIVAGCQPLNPLTKLPQADALPEPETSYVDLGLKLLRQNRVELARDAFIRSLRLEGDTATALSGAGIASERQGLLTDALRFFQRASRVAPDSVLAHNNLGTIYYRLGQYQAARRSFQSAYALSSGENRVAERNLRLSEIAIRENNLAVVSQNVNPLQVRRTGTGVYELIENPITDADG